MTPPSTPVTRSYISMQTPSSPTTRSMSKKQTNFLRPGAHSMELRDVPERVSSIALGRGRRAVGESVRGYLYTAKTSTFRKVYVKTKASGIQFGSRKIPQVHARALFRCPPTAIVHHCFVVARGRTFLAYGFSHHSFPVNATISQLKPTTEWRGDVVVVCLGSRKGLLRAPQITRNITDLVASVFVARVTERVDLGLIVPFVIEV